MSEAKGHGVSIFVIKWTNFLTMWFGVGVMCCGIYMNAQHDECRRYLTLPIVALGAFILAISVVGFVGALKRIALLLTIYLLVLCLLLVAVLLFTVVAFILTNGGTGHVVSGQSYKEYRIQEYNPWFVKQLNDSRNWERLKSCFVTSEDCRNIGKEYKTLKQFKQAELRPIEAGCCQPPTECGFPAINSTFYDLSFHPTSRNVDCKIYRNSLATKCYNCDSCKAGVAEYVKSKWRTVAIFNVILFVVLAAIYVVGCYARRDAATARSNKV